MALYVGLLGTDVLHHLGIIGSDLQPELYEDQYKMSEQLLRCQLVIELGRPESLIIDSTEAMQRTWRRRPPL